MAFQHFNNMAYIKTKEGMFVESGNDGNQKVVTDPVALRDLFNGKTPYTEGVYQDSGTPAPQSTPQPNNGDPASMFNAGVVSLLNDAKNRTNAVNAVIGGQKNKLTNESLNLSNPLESTPYAPLLDRKSVV